jgi:sensor histidine kinase regulating citrate/malate metabolism
MMMINRNIDFDYKIFSDLSFLDSYDVVSLMGNVMDNAIEAQNKVIENRFIKLYIGIEDEKTVIEIKNSYNKDELIIEDNELKTLKGNKDSHGLGLSIIEEITHKYQGEYNIKMTEKEFITFIAFNRLS